MSEEKRMTQVWVSWETYRGLLTVRGIFRRSDGKIRNMDEVIAELIEFWKKTFTSHEKTHSINALPFGWKFNISLC